MSEHILAFLDSTGCEFGNGGIFGPTDRQVTVLCCGGSQLTGNKDVPHVAAVRERPVNFDFFMCLGFGLLCLWFRIVGVDSGISSLKFLRFGASGLEFKV